MINRKIIDVLTLALLLGLSPALKAETRADVQVLKSIWGVDIQQFKSALANGYDVNGFVEGRSRDWLMCDVTRPDRIAFLKHAVSKGGDVDLIKPGISQAFSSPLMCAISFGNKEAFDYLLANGADPNIIVCPKCESKHRDLPITTALYRSQFQMAFELIEKTNITTNELETMRGRLEDSRYLPDVGKVSQEPYRLKLAEYLESKGFELNIWTLEKENAGEWLPTFMREAK